MKRQEIEMVRLALCIGLIVAVLLGCAATNNQSRGSDSGPGLEELAEAQTRLELRVEEVTRNLMALRARLDAQETVTGELARAAKEPEAPPLRVVKLAPPPKPKPAREAREPSNESPAATKLYSRAFNAYREERYGQAILDFEEFLRLYSDHAHADNARYWIGESFYSQGEYKQALVEFNRVFDLYPHEDKAPDALLKIGHSYEKLGDSKNARVFWRRVSTLYPESEAARKAQEALDAVR